MAEGNIVLFDTLNKQENTTLNQELPVLSIQDTSTLGDLVPKDASDFVGILFDSMEEYIDNLLKKADAPKAYQIFSKFKFVGISGIASYTFEIEKAEEQGYTGYRAKFIAAGQVVASTFATTIATAATTAAAVGIASAVGVSSVPVAASVVLSVGGAYVYGKAYDKLARKKVGELLADIEVDKNELIPDNQFQQPFNFDTDTTLVVDTDASKELEPFSQYTVIPKTSGGISVPLNEKDRAIFLNDEPIQAVIYLNVQGSSGVNVNLEDGVTKIMGSDVIKDFLGNAIQNVTGTNFDDKIIGNEVANELNGASGRDYIEGGKGNDIINVGMEIDLSTNRKWWETDDIAIGGEDQDSLIGIVQNSNWSDDFEFNYSNLFGRILEDGFARKYGYRSQINAQPYVGDALYGNSGSDQFYLGMGDKAMDANPTEGDTIFIYKDGTNPVIKQTGGVFNRSHSPLIGSSLSPSWGSLNSRDITNPERFTTESKLIVFEPTGERGAKASLNFPGILQNEAGDEMLLRFPEGMVVINADGTYSFITNAETKRVNNGDFGYQFATFEGYQANTNSYVIGDGQWTLDVQNELTKIFDEDNTSSVIGKIQSWLRSEVFPAVDPFRRALIGDNNVYYTYDYYGEDGTLYGLHYDEQGRENYDNYPGNAKAASTSTYPSSTDNLDNNQLIHAKSSNKNAIEELNSSYTNSGSSNFFTSLFNVIEPPFMSVRSLIFRVEEQLQQIAGK